MLEQLEALRALKEAGTTARAATRLRVTQSAISKRIAALEAQVGAPLVERGGRGSRLTPAGESLVAEAVPILARLAELVESARTTERTVILRLGATESLLSSWLPLVLRKAWEGAKDGAPASEELRLELHAHRGPTLVERVRAGDYDLGICVESGAPKDLVERSLGEEPMIIVPSRLQRRMTQPIEVWTIEERSLTWEALRLRLRHPRPDIVVTARLESFTALVQSAKAGLCHALVPRGVAIAMGVPERSLVELPGLSRPIALVARRRTLARAPIARFVRALQAAWPKG